MNENQKVRRSIINQLESLSLTGITYIPTNTTPREESGQDLDPSDSTKMATVNNPEKNLPSMMKKAEENRASNQEAGALGTGLIANKKDSNRSDDTGRNIKIEASWKSHLASPFSAPYMTTLSSFLREEKTKGKRIYPPGNQIFRAFELTPFDSVKVVILGQDPYHGPSQAHGLSFSVAAGVQPPPSLRNIYRELEEDLGIKHPGHGNLENWARRGVLLLNTCLTVEEGQAGSHQGKGWERFTDEVICSLNDERQNLVFILWGRKAQDKGTAIDRSRHHVITSVHPSPLSASNGFFGSKPFSQANTYLKETGQLPIDWNPN